MINIRPHHLLCIHGFRGKGYSDEFVESMTSIVHNIKKSKETQLNVVFNTDTICANCPHKIGENLCTTQEHILTLDNKVTSALDLQEKSYAYNEIQHLITQKLTPGDFDHICGSCQWYSLGYCKEGLFLT